MQRATFKVVTRYLGLLAILSLGIVLLLACGGGGGGGVIPGPGDTTPGGTYSWPQPGEFRGPTGNNWTIMIYLNADNSLSGLNIDDFNEMVDAGGSQNGVNIIVFMDDSENPATLHFVEPGGYINSNYIYTCGGDTCRNMGEVNMGDPNVLKDFVSWAISYYPANHYMLVIWNHGGGWRSAKVTSKVNPLKEVSCDEDSGGDCITIPELRSALAQVTATLGRKLDVLGFDACLMGTIEVAYNLREYADYIIASEFTIPGTGWDYTFISEAVNNPAITPVDLSRQVLAYYDSYYTGGGLDYTLALIDTSKFSTVISSLNTLASQLLTENPVDVSSALGGGVGDSYVSRPLRDYVSVLTSIVNSSALSATTKTAAQDALNAFNSSGLVVDFVYGGYTGVGGLTIYSPTSSETYDSSYASSQYPFANDTSWDEVLSYIH